ncbi:SDR family oxidoreductase [Pedobacter sp. MR2016-24]|uniref:SDR family oxidoreductase n=1 Tax=Pedobacter sp. MR2016-24 TaxID=2994466 RepID=UPI002246E805|nr:SDR family oxidoreductase [Pedobacter sp. MR2016-24]MCX2484664.1 SDR family NAD(P)-dependent oxidoreductase [Pedobacter sp. MR2016-24]
MNIDQAKVLITGGTTGIGYETAKLLRAQGASVVICGRNEDTVKSAAAELDVFGIKADVDNVEEIEAMFTFAIEKMGGLNVLINNAGLGHIGSLLDTSLEDFTNIWITNTRSIFVCGQLAARHFIQQNEGNIINIASMAAVNGFANGSAYSSSKAAITGLTNSWRAELRKYNIRVTQINPSEVITSFSEKIGYTSSAPETKLKGLEIAQVIVSTLALNGVAMIPEINVWATNPGS